MLLWPLLLIIGLALADVEIINPRNGSSYTPSGGTVSINVQWRDDNNDPYLSDMKWYSMTLNAGPNDNIRTLEHLAQNVEASSISQNNGVYSVTVEIDSDAHADGQFFIQVYAAITQNASANTIHYTPRFTLHGMTGSGPISYTALAPPPPLTDYTGTYPYQRQTGFTRTAPMQRQPSTRVTATTWARQFPTSAVTYFRSFSPSPQCHTTLTPGWSYSLQSGINYATAQPRPSQNGGWYNPKRRQSLSTRKLNVSERLRLTSRA